MGNAAVCVRESTYATHLDVLNDGVLGPEGKKLFNGAGNNQYEYAHVCGFHPLTSVSHDSSSSPGRGYDVKVPSTDSSSLATNNTTTPAVFASGGNSSTQMAPPRSGFSVEYRLNCRPCDQVPFCPEFDDKSQSPEELHWNSSSG